LQLLSFRLGRLSGDPGDSGAGSFGTVLFIIGHVPASGRMMEHLVYFIPVPMPFYTITFFEVLFQTMLLGLMVMWWEEKLNQGFHTLGKEPPIYTE
jgi:hypothetical protein